MVWYSIVLHNKKGHGMRSRRGHVNNARVERIEGVGRRGREERERAEVRSNTPEGAPHHSAQDSEPERVNCQEAGS